MADRAQTATTDEVAARVRLLKRAKRLAREYYRATGRPLGVTGEVAEYEAERLLPDIELAPVRQPGYDAVRVAADGREETIQIKGRCLLPTSKPGQRLGKLDLKKPWDVAMLVLLDETFETTAIYEADRRAVRKALTKPGSKARNERGQLAVSKFKAIGKLVYPPS